VSRQFTLEEAREALPVLRDLADRLVSVRAELTVASHAQQQGDESVTIADLKGLDARMSELIDEIAAQGVEIKGIAPVLVDFPSTLDGKDVLLCWLEGEEKLEWYHETAHGFAGRRRLDDA
jgi:hypothetical protein